MEQKSKIEEQIVELQASSQAKGAVEHAKRMLDINQELLESIDSLLAERQNVVDRIETYKRFLGLASNEGQKGLAAQQIHTTTTTEDEFARTSTRKAAKTVLQRTGQPMTSSEIAGQLRAGGKRLGTKEVSTVSAALRYGVKKGEFHVGKHNGKLVWRLSEWGN